MIKNSCPNIAKKLFILLIVSLIFATLIRTAVHALTSETINFQGKIVRNDTGYEGLNVIPGSPACVVSGAGNDTCDFRVSYYTASSGGTLLLTEDFSNVEIGQYDGVFDLSLGSGSVTTSAQCRDGTCNNVVEVISEYTNVYLELKFSPDGTNLTETFSRMPLEASAYSLYSKYAGGSSDAFRFSNSISTDSQNNPVAGMVYFDPNDDQLKVYDGLSWTGVGSGSELWTDAGTFTHLTATTDDLVLGASTVADATFFFDVDGSSGSYLEIDNASNTDRLFTILSGGNVGIGVISPTSKLEVAGASSTISNSSGDLTIMTGGDNGDVIITPNGTGKVGIGTTSPNQLLSVAGTFGIQDTGTTPTHYTIFQGGDQSTDITYTLPTSSVNGLLRNTGGVWSWDTTAYISQAYATVQEEGVGVTQRSILNFVGSGFTAADDSGNSRTNITLDSDLNALADLATTGIVARTAANTYTMRTITGTSGTISVTNGNGVSGNPTITIDATYLGQTSITTLGTIGTGIWQGTTIDELYGGTGNTSYATGDILYASGANTLAKRTIGNTGDILTVSAGGVPTWVAPAATHNALTLAAIGSTPNANGMTLAAGQVLNLEPASASYGGVVTTTTQTFAGNKSFDGTLAIKETGTTPTYYTTFQGGDQGGNVTYTLPTSSTNGLLRNTGGTWTWDNTTYISQAYTTIEKDGTPLTQRTTLNFIGGGYTAADVGGETAVALDGDLNALAALSTTGMMARTAANTYTMRTITGTSGTISVTNGNGVSGNPTITIDATYLGQTSITTLGTIGTGIWQGTTIDELYGGTGNTSYATGDILYASGANTLVKRTIGNNNQVLTVSGGVPTWQDLPSELKIWTDAGTFTYLTSKSDDMVLGATTVADATFFFDVDGGSGSYLEIDDATNTNRLLTILSGGNVGVGVSNPTSKLEVAGMLQVITTASNDGIYQSDGTRWLRYMAGTTSAGDYNPLVQANDNAIIYSNGTSGSGALFIGPWSSPLSSSKHGLRMDGTTAVYTGLFNLKPGAYGGIVFSTPSGTNGITIYTNDTNGYRSDIRRTSNGISFNTHAATGTPSNNQLILYDSGNSYFGGAVQGRGPVLSANTAPTDAYAHSDHLYYYTDADNWGGFGGYTSGAMWMRMQELNFFLGSVDQTPTRRFYFTSAGSGYADVSWTTFSPYLSYNYTPEGKSKSEFKLGEIVSLTSERWTIDSASTGNDNVYGVVVLPEGFVSIPKEMKKDVSTALDADEYIASREDIIPIAHLGEASTIVVVNPGENIEVGEKIAVSAIPGVGEKVNKTGNVLGRALEGTSMWGTCQSVSSIASIAWPSDDGSNPTKPCFRLPDGKVVGKIMVFVDVSWYEQSETYTTQSITNSGWYRLAKLNGPDDYAKLKISNSSVGSSQNLILSVDTVGDRENVNIISNFTTGGYDISSSRINTVSGVKYLEVYLESVNNNSIKVNIDGDITNWITTDVTFVENPTLVNKEYQFKGLLFGVSETLEVGDESVNLKGSLLTKSDGIYNIGDNINRWNDIYAKGAIRLGSGVGKEGAIRFNVEKQMLEFSNDGQTWMQLGDLGSQMVLSPEYQGAILFADGTDNYGSMTSDAVETSGGFKNYYEWVSDRDTTQDYDILVRVTLPNDFVSWKEDAIYLDFMTENSASIANNSVDMYLIGSNGVDAQVEDGISKLPAGWERVSIKGLDIDDCNTAGDTCTLRINVSSSQSYFVRVGDITLNYNRGL